MHSYFPGLKFIEAKSLTCWSRSSCARLLAVLAHPVGRLSPPRPVRSARARRLAARMRALVLVRRGGVAAPAAHPYQRKAADPVAGSHLFHALEAIRDAGIERGRDRGRARRVDEVRAAVGDGRAWDLR